MLISIVTAVHLPAVHHLVTAWESLKDQKLPDGVTFEWLIQEDGDSIRDLPIGDSDDRIRFESGIKAGIAATRNYALGRASGRYVKNLDADDQLLPGTLMRDLAALENSGASWSTCAVIDLLPDGSMKRWDHADPPPGVLTKGSVYEAWARDGYRLPVHPTTLMANRELVLRLGGWMGIPVSEDTGLLIALSQVANGVFISEPGLLYRKWPGQITADETFSIDRDRRHRTIAARARALHNVHI